MHARTLPAAGFLSLVLGFLLLLAASPAGAQGFGKNKVQYRTFQWSVVSSPHFDVYFYPGGDSLALRVLDLAEKANIKLTRDMGHILSNKVPIILYISHHDFAQTNVTTEMLDSGTGGFTELLKNRVVLPFTGSYDDLRHVVVHELTHAFMFDMIYSGGLPSFVTRQNVVDVPLWFAEGLAEWNSLGWEPNAEMFVRDGIISGYLPPIMFNGGYLVYKQGQAALRYMSERYGDERIRDLLQKIKFHRNFYRAFESAMGTTVEKFSDDFDAWCKRTWWPSVARKGSPEEFARRLTDHRHDRSNINMAAAVSPLGDRVAYISDRNFYTDIYVLSTLDGKVQERVIRGESGAKFEQVPSFRAAISWSSDGRRIAFVAESQARDVIYVADADDGGKIVRKHQFEFDSVSYPTFSPTDDRIAFVAVKNGRSDLYVVAPDGTLTRLTDDTWDEKELCWSPDGQRIAFSSDRGHPVVLLAAIPTPDSFGDTSIWEIDVATKHTRQVVNTSGHDDYPAWAPDGQSLAFVSDRGGAQNVYLYDPSDEKILQLTDIIGGVFSLSWSRDNDRVVFSAFNEGGWDIFVAKEPLSLKVVRQKLAERRPQALMSLDQAMKDIPLAVALPDTTHGALAPVWPDTMASATNEVPESFEPGHTVADSATLNREVGVPGVASYSDRMRVYQDSVRTVDSLRVARAGIDPRYIDAPFLLPDSLLSQQPQPYRRKFSTEFAAGNLGFNSAFGLAGSTVISISDFLGNDRFVIMGDIFAGSIDEANIFAYYYYLPKRWDYGLGVFHYKSYYFTRVSSLGEVYSEARRFADRTVGLSGLASYPFNRFKRVDFDMTATVIDRTFFTQDQFGYLYPTGSEMRSVTAPSATYVSDTSLYSYYGPIDGTRYSFYATTAVPIFPKGLSYTTLAVDWRRYFNLGGDYQFAMRGRAIRSMGRDAQVFEAGGFSTIRGYEDFSLRGTNVTFANLELRFPFINAFGVVGPLPLGFLNLRGAAFTDFGAVWTRDDTFRLSAVNAEGVREARSILMSSGVGVRSALGFVLLRLDVAWPYNFEMWGRPMYHFSLSPQF